MNRFYYFHPLPSLFLFIHRRIQQNREKLKADQQAAAAAASSAAAAASSSSTSGKSPSTSKVDLSSPSAMWWHHPPPFSFFCAHFCLGLPFSLFPIPFQANLLRAHNTCTFGKSSETAAHFRQASQPASIYHTRTLFTSPSPSHFRPLFLPLSDTSLIWWRHWRHIGALCSSRISSSSQAGRQDGRRHIHATVNAQERTHTHYAHTKTILFYMTRTSFDIFRAGEGEEEEEGKGRKCVWQHAPVVPPIDRHNWS